MPFISDANCRVEVAADGCDFIFFHSLDTVFPSAARPPLFQELKWTPDGWPYFGNKRPKLSKQRFELP